MTLGVDLVRARRRRRLSHRPFRRLGTAAAVWAAVLVVAAGAAGAVAAFAFDDLTRDLPAVREIEGSFDPASGAYLPTQYFDRSGQVLYVNAQHRGGDHRDLALAIRPTR